MTHSIMSHYSSFHLDLEYSRNNDSALFRATQCILDSVLRFENREMFDFATLEIDSKINNLTISYQYKTVYIGFQARADVFINSTNEKVFSKWENGKLKFCFGDFSECRSLEGLLDKPETKLKVLLKLCNNSYEKEFSKNNCGKDIKTIKILSLECVL